MASSCSKHSNINHMMSTVTHWPRLSTPYFPFAIFYFRFFVSFMFTSKKCNQTKKKKAILCISAQNIEFNRRPRKKKQHETTTTREQTLKILLVRTICGNVVIFVFLLCNRFWKIVYWISLFRKSMKMRRQIESSPGGSPLASHEDEQRREKKKV